MHEKARELAAQLTLDEQLSLIKGLGTWSTCPVERLGLPGILMSDGPHGIRKQETANGDHLGLGESIKTVCFPTASGTAASFDRALLKELGEVLGDECRAQELAILLGPAVNIKRSPLCGRNFEYFSEDPYLAAEMSVNYTQGLQSKGVGVSVKHFAANNQEKRRMTVTSVVDERALREIYFPAFEQTVKRADPWTIMCAYNRLFDGIYCSENKRLLTDILREEWGFEGIVVSDWGAVSNRAKGVEAGLDLEMPDSRGFHTEKLKAAVESGELSQEALLEACARMVNLILRAVENAPAQEELPLPVDNCEDHAKAREYAKSTMVLLKNENNTLPLRKDVKASFIGGFARQPRFQGGGSSHVNAFHVSSAMETALAMELPVEYAEGFGVADYEYDIIKAKQAIALAEISEVAVIFAGLPEAMDSEGADRKHMDLPPCQTELIRAIAKVQPNIVVVLHNGGPVTMPWVNDVPAILESYLAGEAVGEAQIDLLYGDANPSAKLAETFPLRLQDTSCYDNFPGNPATVEYRESIYVGYRYYDKAEKEVLFPFGHGLSYTKFAYSNLRASRKSIAPADGVDVSVTVTNTGDVDGAEVVQFYVAPPADDNVFRAPKELKGFDKVFLKAGEKARVTVHLDARAFAYYNTDAKDFVCTPGEYTIMAAASSRDIRAEIPLKLSCPEVASPYAGLDLPAYFGGKVHHVSDAEFEAVLGYPIPPTHYPVPRRMTLDSTLEDAQQGKFGRAVMRVIQLAVPFVSKKASDTSIGDLSGFVETATEIPVRSLAIFASKIIDAEMADAIVSLFNDEKIFASLFTIVKGGINNIRKSAAAKE